MKKHNAFFLALIVAIFLFACKSSSNKSVSSDNEDILKADTIPFFTTIKQLYNYKDSLIKDLGPDVKISSVEFADTSQSLTFGITAMLVNKKMDSTISYHFTMGKEPPQIYRNASISTKPSPVITLDELSFKAIPAILKNFKEKNKCDNYYDSCVIFDIYIDKRVNEKNNDSLEIRYKIGTIGYRGGHMVEGENGTKTIIADKDGNIYDWDYDSH